MTVCNQFESDELKNEDRKYTNVEYSEDGKSITIYLNGNAPVPANRALGKFIAQLGYNFFEVTFCYNDGGTNKITRAAWELGEPAGVNGVYRTAGGVNYYGANPVGTPATIGEGTAVLFVGEKSDKTLLAVGTLSHIDNIPVGTNPRITLDTAKVTFELNALKAGVATNTADSSFNTTSPPSPGTLSAIPGDISGLSFPYFPLPINSSVDAYYKFSFEAAAHGYSFYQPAIIYAGGATASIIRPQWTFPPDIEKYESIYPFSNDDNYGVTTTVDVTYPVTGYVGSAFNGTVLFTIGTAAEPKQAIAALVVRVPVCAVSNIMENPVTWYIKPGFGNYHRELDNGLRETGGAVLLGIGITGGNPPTGIEIKGTSQKYYYPNYEFNLSGLQIIYRQGYQLTDITPSDPYDWSSIPNLTFYYDSIADDPERPYENNANTLLTPPFTFGSDFYGYKVLIRVVYNIIHEATFLVEVNDAAYIEIPYQHRVFLAKPNDFSQVANRVANEGGGYWLFIFTENVNIREMAFNSGAAGAVIYMVATVPGVVIGREGSAVIRNNNNNSAAEPITIYVGTWPFNEPAFAGGDVITNYFFSINAGGTWENYSAGPSATGNMFQSYVLGGVNLNNLKVNVLSNITVANRGFLGP